jgi:hypothetical protein
MRKFVYYFFLICLLSACKKDPAVTGENRLTKTTIVGSSSYKSEFEYDASGRLVKNTSSQNGNAPVVQTQLNYTGNEIAISYPTEPSGIQTDTRYQLDGQNRPIKRTYSNLLTTTNPNGPEKHFDSETTDYVYNALGSLASYAGVIKDSLSYYPTTGVLQNSVDNISYTAVFEIFAGNLKSVKKTSLRNYTQVNQPGGTYNIQETIEETTVFSYDKNYPNHFDFKNAFLFTELSVLPIHDYFPNALFLNYPNKAVTTKITKNAAGVVVSTSVYADEPNLTFDTNEYILTNIFDPQTKLVFSYSRF